MSGVFRSMRAVDDKPEIGNQRDMLGVREDGSDISIEVDRAVRPGTGGLSIAPGWRTLPSGMIPRRLKAKMPDARGSNRLTCFRLSDRTFVDGPIEANLAVRVDSPSHGLIEPVCPMPIDEYQASLAATRDLWVIDED